MLITSMTLLAVTTFPAAVLLDLFNRHSRADISHVISNFVVALHPRYHPQQTLQILSANVNYTST